MTQYSIYLKVQLNATSIVPAGSSITTTGSSLTIEISRDVQNSKNYDVVLIIEPVGMYYVHVHYDAMIP